MQVKARHTVAAISCKQWMAEDFDRKKVFVTILTKLQSNVNRKKAY